MMSHSIVENVVKQGYLKKGNFGASRLSGFFRRSEGNKWFVFTIRQGVPFLEYYDTDVDVFLQQPINSFNLSNCQNVKSMGNTNPPSFCIVCPERIIELVASSRTQMVEWVNEVEASLTRLGILKNEAVEHVYSVCPAVVRKSRTTREDFEENDTEPSTSTLPLAMSSSESTRQPVEAPANPLPSRLSDTIIPQHSPPSRHRPSTIKPSSRTSLPNRTSASFHASSHSSASGQAAPPPLPLRFFSHTGRTTGQVEAVEAVASEREDRVSVYHATEGSNDSDFVSPEVIAQLRQEHQNHKRVLNSNPLNRNNGPSSSTSTVIPARDMNIVMNKNNGPSSTTSPVIPARDMNIATNRNNGPSSTTSPEIPARDMNIATNRNNGTSSSTSPVIPARDMNVFINRSYFECSLAVDDREALQQPETVNTSEPSDFRCSSPRLDDDDDSALDLSPSFLDNMAKSEEPSENFYCAFPCQPEATDSGVSSTYENYPMGSVVSKPTPVPRRLFSSVSSSPLEDNSESHPVFNEHEMPVVSLGSYEGLASDDQTYSNVPPAEDDSVYNNCDIDRTEFQQHIPHVVDDDGQTNLAEASETDQTSFKLVESYPSKDENENFYMIYDIEPPTTTAPPIPIAKSSAPPLPASTKLLSTVAAKTMPAPTLPAPTLPVLPLPLPTNPVPPLPVPTNPVPPLPVPTNPVPPLPVPTNPVPPLPVPTNPVPPLPVPTNPVPPLPVPTNPVPPLPVPTIPVPPLPVPTIPVPPLPLPTIPVPPLPVPTIPVPPLPVPTIPVPPLPLPTIPVPPLPVPTIPVPPLPLPTIPVPPIALPKIPVPPLPAQTHPVPPLTVPTIPAPPVPPPLVPAPRIPPRHNSLKVKCEGSKHAAVLEPSSTVAGSSTSSSLPPSAFSAAAAGKHRSLSYEHSVVPSLPLPRKSNTNPDSLRPQASAFTSSNGPGPLDIPPMLPRRTSPYSFLNEQEQPPAVPSRNSQSFFIKRPQITGLSSAKNCSEDSSSQKSSSSESQVAHEDKPPETGASTGTSSLSRKMLLDRAHSLHTVVSLKQTQAEILATEISMPSVPVTITQKAGHGIALVDWNNFPCVVGWNQKDFPSLHGKLHLGDLILSINSVSVTSSETAQKLLRQAPSSKIEIILHRMPYAKVFAIHRSAEGQDLGLKREGGTGEIVLVDPSGLAAQHGLTSHSQSAFGNGRCNWFLTEINNRPLSLFFKENEIDHRLLAVGREISLVVQPCDFVYEIRRQFKKLKNYKSFITQ